MKIMMPKERNVWELHIGDRAYVYDGGKEYDVPGEVYALLCSMANYPPKGDKPADTVVTVPMLTKLLESYAKTADVMPKAGSITGYDAEKVQTLKNDGGTLKFVDDAAGE